MSGLGRVQSPDTEHLDKYPLTAGHLEEIVRPQPVVLGVNWHTSFDNPEVDKAGHYWIGKDPRNLGTVRGGHCICAVPVHAADPDRCWDWYNQGEEGACVGFGCSRAVSVGHGRGARYQAYWLYRRAQILEGDAPGAEGAQVRSGLEVLRTEGNAHQGSNLVMTDAVLRDRAIPSAGISAYRWITTTQDLLQVLGQGGLSFIELINSWGRQYPHRVRMPAETVAALLSEGGEAAVVTDR